ncbi:MAG: AtpZ/AtpI family protein [Deltaproteobacteria bacterium]|nr:AtpZ/AtpI family protein [Deltaproteobacteria bacterium]
MEKWKSYGKQIRSTVSYSTVGIEMGLSVGLGYLLGDWLDSRFGWEPWGMIALVLLGSAAGFVGLARALKRMKKQEDD